MKFAPWEQGQDQKTIDDFKRSYEDRSLSLKLIAANFGMSHASVPTVAQRLGCPMRPPSKHATRPNPGSSVHVIEDQIEKLRTELASLEQKKIDLEMRVERQGSYIRVLGLDCDVLVSATLWARWLRAGGPAKVRHLITEAEWTA